MENLLQVVTSLEKIMTPDDAVEKYEMVSGLIGKLINLEKEKIRCLEELREVINHKVKAIKKPPMKIKLGSIVRFMPGYTYDPKPEYRVTDLSVDGLMAKLKMKGAFDLNEIHAGTNILIVVKE